MRYVQRLCERNQSHRRRGDGVEFKQEWVGMSKANVKKLNELSKEERFRIKGLNDFIENIDKVAHEEFDKIIKKAVPRYVSNAQVEDYRHMFKAGFLKAMEMLVVKINDSTGENIPTIELQS